MCLCLERCARIDHPTVVLAGPDQPMADVGDALAKEQAAPSTQDTVSCTQSTRCHRHHVDAVQYRQHAALIAASAWKAVGCAVLIAVSSASTATTHSCCCHAQSWNRAGSSFLHWQFYVGLCCRNACSWPLLRGCGARS